MCYNSSNKTSDNKWQMTTFDSSLRSGSSNKKKWETKSQGRNLLALKLPLNNNNNNCNSHNDNELLKELIIIILTNYNYLGLNINLSVHSSNLTDHFKGINFASVSWKHNLILILILLLLLSLLIIATIAKSHPPLISITVHWFPWSREFETRGIESRSSVLTDEPQEILFFEVCFRGFELVQGAQIHHQDFLSSLKINYSIKKTMSTITKILLN